MTAARSILIAFAGASMLALAACGDDDTAQAPVTPPRTDGQQNRDRAERATEDAARNLGEAAEAVKNEALRLGEEARKAAEKALEDAGPLIDRAGEAAVAIGRSMSEILDRAASDLNKAVDALENGGTNSAARPETGDPAADLAPPDRLKADTRAAARAYPAGVGPAYVGVWAGDAASCARIDQEAVEIFAVITPTTIRRYESVCNFAAAPMEGDSVTVTATCIAEGEEEERPITLAMSEPGRLSIGMDGAAGADLVRCHLPD